MEEHPLSDLREALLSSLDQEQLVSLCGAMGIAQTGLRKDSPEHLTVRLTEHASRHGRLSDLIGRARQLAPGPQWDALDLPADLRAASALRHQLSSHVQGFVGRELELERLADILARRPSGVILYGTGGVGKTSLAVHAGHQVSDLYPDGQLMVRILAESSSPVTAVSIAERVIHAFDPEQKMPQDEEALLRQYRRSLSGQSVLILIDGATKAEQIAPLVPPAGSAVLVTSRQPLAVPGLELLHLGALAEDQARQLLVDATGTDSAAAELDKISALCGRLPLAIRIVAGLMVMHPDWSVNFIVRELAEERVQLASIQFEDAEVEAAMGLAVGQMVMRQPELAARWQMLSVFPSSFDLIAAAAVWGVKDHEALDDISQLVSRGLLNFDAQAGLYDLHPLVRHAARDAFEYDETGGSGEGEPMQELIDRIRARLGLDPEQRRMGRAVERHADHYLSLGVLAAERYENGAARRLDGLRRFDSSWPHLKEGWARMRDRDDRRAARWTSDLARHTAPILALRLMPQSRVPILEAAATSAMRIGDRRSQAAHLGNLGLAYADRGEPQRAIAYHRQALGIHARLRNRPMEGYQWMYLGRAYLRLGEPEQAIKCYQKVLDIQTPLGDVQSQRVGMTGMATAYRRLGDARQAISYFDRALALARGLGDRVSECSTLGNLGEAYRQLNDMERSRQCFEQALAIARRIGDPRKESAALGNLGLAYGSLGDHRRAQACHRQALAIARASGSLREQEIHLGNLGLSCATLGQRERAIAYIQEALALSRQVGDERGEARLSWSLGMLTEWTDPARAARLMEARVRLAEVEGDADLELLRERWRIVQERAEARRRDQRPRGHR